MTPQEIKLQIKERAESDLQAFITLIHRHRVLGNVHREVIDWWTRQDAKSHQLLLLPRDHQKSALVAYRTAWRITKDPTLRVLFISSTANLAIKQLKFIKDIFTSDIYRQFWPEMVNAEEGFREKWTEREISVDHPLRKREAVRDPTIFTAGLTSNIVGMHCDIAVLDDVVERGNAYTEEGREKARSQYSLLSSIEGVNSEEWVVGTRYHPKDLYQDLIGMEIEKYGPDGNVVSKEPLFEVFERAVENVGDGTGTYLWPRQQRYDGKWFGFDQEALDRKRSQYTHNKNQFRAQYYNNPNDDSDSPIPRDHIQYYDPNYLSRKGGRWYYKNSPMNVFAAMDFAFSLRKEADYTAVVVVGVDHQNNYYVLDIDRFKSDKISDYFNHLLKLHEKWDFRKLRAEVSVAQAVIVKDLKENYIRPYGLALSIDEHRPNRYGGTKEERVMAILQPRYANMQMWHYHSGACQILEEELLSANPSHDDVKDALASAVDLSVAPTFSRLRQGQHENQFKPHQRFGGIS